VSISVLEPANPFWKWLYELAERFYLPQIAFILLLGMCVYFLIKFRKLIYYILKEKIEEKLKWLKQNEQEKEIVQ